MNLRFLTVLMSLVIGLCSFSAIAASGGGINERFTKTIYVKFGGASTAGGESYDSAKSCAADGDLWAIPANIVIEKVYVIMDTAVTGSTALDVGDDDDPNGFFDGGVSGMEGATFAAGLYGWDAKVAGAYLRVETAGGTDAADIDVVPAAKAYLATGKEVKLDITTACTAGRFRVVIQGFYFGAK